MIKSEKILLFDFNNKVVKFNIGIEIGINLDLLAHLIHMFFSFWSYYNSFWKQTTPHLSWTFDVDFDFYN